MLAQNFMTAEELGISGPERDALLLVLDKMERGEFRHVDTNLHEFSRKKTKFSGTFNMGAWNESYDCGTVCCIGGAAELLGGIRIDLRDDSELVRLFNPPNRYDYEMITVDEAAQALRSYLTTGKAGWKEILGDRYTDEGA